MLQDILAKVQALRGLEQKAREDIGGQRESDFAALAYYHHLPSPSYKAYESACGELDVAIDGLPRPQGWLALANLAKTFNPSFGRVPEPSGLNEVAWNPSAWTLRSVVLSSIARASPCGLVPGHEIWSHGELKEWIVSLTKRHDLSAIERDLALNLRRRFESRLP